MNKEKKLLIIIVAASFLISLTYSFYFRIEPIVDARAYDNIALELLETGEYPVGAINRPGPGYIYFLAGIYKIFGHSYPVVWFIQSALLAASAFLVFLAAKEIFRDHWHPAVGLVAAALIGLSPDLITVASLLMTETLMIFLICFSAYLFFRYLNGGRLSDLSLSAVFIALSALVRGNVSLLFLPPLIFLLFKKDWKRSAVFAAVFLLCLVPWTVRNWRVYGEIKPFNGSAGVLYVGNHPGASGELRLDYPMPPGMGKDAMSQIDFDNALGQAGKEYIFSNPFQFLKLSFWRMSIYFSAARPFAFWPHLTGISKLATIAASSLYALAIFGLGFVGAVLALSKKSQLLSVIRQKLWLLFGMFLAMPASIAALIVETRYRFPGYPFLAIFAGFAVYLLLTNWGAVKPAMKKIAIAIALFLGNTLFDVLRNLNRILERL